MNARAIRIRKEARALFWPWCTVMVGGALPLILAHSHTAAKINLLAFFFGVPVLATLSLGKEFHEGTFSLWLTQPASRWQLWSEKASVMFVAVVSAGLVSGMALFSLWPHLDRAYEAAAIAYVLITMASATFWTLAARSAIGGFALISTILFVFGRFAGAIANLPVPGEDVGAMPASTPTVAGIAVFALGLAGLMLWLGARKLACFQVTGGSTDADLLVTGPTIVPAAWAEWFRCRPTGASLNLIRKEFRLLRPLWLIGLMVVLYVAFLALFRLLPVPPVPIPRTVIQWVLLGPFASLCLAIAGLAGTLSLGEERTSGTQAWQMTLPVSAGRQWLIKLAVAMVGGVACSVLCPLVPMIAAGWVFGSPLMYVDLGAWSDWLRMAPILILACFWCACAANGAVRAATWAFPATGAVFFAGTNGLRLGQDLARTTGTVRDLMVSWFHWSPLAFTAVTEFFRARVFWLFIPAFLLGLIQSYRLFRMQPQDSVRWVLRCLVPLVVVTLGWSFAMSGGFVASRWRPLDETRQALDRLQLGAAKLELTGEDLTRNSAVTELTRRWLRGASIAVVPDRSHASGYAATIRLASGVECRLKVAYYGGMAAGCGKER